MGALHLVSSATTHPATGGRARYACTVRLIGTDTSGCAFEEDAHTEVVTCDGALIASSRSLAAGATIFIRRDAKLVQARVLVQVGIRQDEHLYGVLFTGSYQPHFWDIPLPDSCQSDGMLMQCSRCSREEFVALHEIEKVVFENMRGVPRPCVSCAQETLWIEPILPAGNELVTGSAAYELDLKPERRQAVRVNRRKHARITMKNVKACLHRDGFADDVVKVLDLSRGGIRFLSAIDYLPNTQVSVSVPYTPEGSNIFSSAKVVRVQTRPCDGILGEFGLQYLPG